MSSPRTRLDRLRRGVRRRVLARRRLLAALCAGVAVAAGVHAVAAPPPPTTEVLIAARNLPAGAVLDDGDLRWQAVPPDAVPDGVEREAVGRVLAAPVRTGEPITDVRLVGSGLADAHPELTTVPVRLPDAGLAALLRTGDRIDLIATDPQAGGSRVVAAGAMVLATPDGASGPATDSSAGATSGAVVVLGVSPGSVPDLAEASVRFFLTYAYSR